MGTPTNEVVQLVPTIEPRYEKKGFLHMRKQRRRSVHGNREADERLCFRYTDSKSLHFLNTKFQAFSHLVLLYSPVTVGHGLKTGFLTTRLNLCFETK